MGLPSVVQNLPPLGVAEIKAAVIANVHGHLDQLLAPWTFGVHRAVLSPFQVFAVLFPFADYVGFRPALIEESHDGGGCHGFVDAWNRGDIAACRATTPSPRVANTRLQAVSIGTLNAN